MKELYRQLRQRLAAMTFRTGVVVAAVCVLCYAISFGQMLLPISVAAKGILWFIFFGLAKTCQYAALLILGKAGVARLRALAKSRRTAGGAQ